MFKRFVVNVVLVSFVSVILTRIARNVKIGAFLNSNKDNSFKRSVSFASGFLGDVSIQESVTVDSDGKRIYRFLLLPDSAIKVWYNRYVALFERKQECPICVFLRLLTNLMSAHTLYAFMHAKERFAMTAQRVSAYENICCL